MERMYTYISETLSRNYNIKTDENCGSKRCLYSNIIVLNKMISTLSMTCYHNRRYYVHGEAIIVYATVVPPPANNQSHGTHGGSLITSTTDIFNGFSFVHHCVFRFSARTPS